MQTLGKRGNKMGVVKEGGPVTREGEWVTRRVDG